MNNIIPEFPSELKKKYEFVDLNLRGSGKFGEIYLIRDIKVKTEYILKMISKQKTEKDYFDKEKDFLLNVKGTNIINLIDYYEDKKDDYYYFVFEKMEGDLQQLLETKFKNGIPSETIRKIFLQINSGLKIMHDLGKCHRDLKPSNILYSFIDDNKNDFIIKLADFGQSTDLISTDIATSNIGTFLYRAPEIENKNDINSEYSNNCDLYSLGIILYKLKTGKDIFGAISEKFYENRKKNKFTNTGDELLDDLIKNIVVYEPKQRLSWDEYFNHPFFKGKIFDLLLELNNKIYNQNYINGIIYY
jgi:serine/threonine protein kinase